MDFYITHEWWQIRCKPNTSHAREKEWGDGWARDTQRKNCFNETASNKNDCSTAAAAAEVAMALAKALETMRRTILVEQIYVINIMKRNKFVD